MSFHVTPTILYGTNPKRSKTFKNRLGTRNVSVPDRNVFKCCSRFPDTFENVQKPKTFTPAIYRKASGNLEPFKNLRKTSDFREQKPIFWRRFQIRRSCASNVQYVFSGAKMCRKNFKKLSKFLKKENNS